MEFSVKKIYLIVLFVMLQFSCNKSIQPFKEEAISFSLDASNASISLGSNFGVTVTLTSKIPSSKGIQIAATITDQTTNNSINQNPAVISTAVQNSISLINLPQQHWCYATIKVSSVATPSNTDSQGFTVVYK